MKLIADLVLTTHLLWICFALFGAFFTRGRRFWTAFHIVSLVWGIVVEVGPWPCPLTLAEQSLDARAGIPSYQGSFLLHYLNLIIYPNLPWWLIEWVGVSICALNLGIYGWRLRNAMVRRRAAGN